MARAALQRQHQHNQQQQQPLGKKSSFNAAAGGGNGAAARTGSGGADGSGAADGSGGGSGGSGGALRNVTPVLWMVLWTVACGGFLLGYTSGPSLVAAPAFRETFLHSSVGAPRDHVGWRALVF